MFNCSVIVEQPAATPAGLWPSAAGPGNDAVLGGIANDTIGAGDGDNIVLGDNGYIDYTAAERSYPTVPSPGDDLNPADIDRISTTNPNNGGNDTQWASGAGTRRHWSTGSPTRSSA